MFLNRLKEISADKALKKVLSSGYLSDAVSTGKINSFACILNIDEFNHAEVFFELAKELDLRQDQFKIIGFTEGSTDNHSYSFPVFSPKDLKWKGKVENGDVQEFLDKKYDVLLNYYNDAPLILMLVSAYTKADFKVGLLSKNEALNNMIMDIRPKEFSKFKTEFVKYLSILKKI
ncbi:hypothetical protein GWK08_07625 [Leptobacterium flavescens]|uniref:Uncharacterized protein n=1 Tax=Leptobacterium flavescens TaxID=472055 RepID=A0A6P0ULA4_9FLAO|nr:hypothetical protein [Leptobacterium flavescens]NER13302.1 hypothetical protein [Leptobacterium flavescens]